jgi:acyl transferase domain-containing protein
LALVAQTCTYVKAYRSIQGPNTNLEIQFILDSAASFGLSASKGIPRRPSYPPRKHLLLFSANHTEALAKLAENYKNYLEKHPGDLESMAYTLAERREHLKLRTFCVTDGSAPFEVAANAKVQATSQVAFVFTGQGAQWVHMGRELMRDFPPFMDSIRSADEVLQSVEHAPSWTIEG